MKRSYFLIVILTAKTFAAADKVGTEHCRGGSRMAVETSAEKITQRQFEDHFTEYWKKFWLSSSEEKTSKQIKNLVNTVQTRNENVTKAAEFVQGNVPPLSGTIKKYFRP